MSIDLTTTRNLCENFTETFTCSKDKDATPFDVTCTFDMSLLNDADVLELMKRTLVISKQNKIRTHLNAKDQDSAAWRAFDNSTEKVQKPGTRAGAKAPEVKVAEILSKMTPDARKAAIAKYMAELEAEEANEAADLASAVEAAKAALKAAK